MLAFVLLSLSSLFAVIDPLGCLPFFSGLTAHQTERQKRRTLYRALVVSFCVLALFTWLGNALLALFGITIDAFRIAGGVIFFGIGLDMIQSQPRRWRTGISRSAEPAPQEADAPHQDDDPSITPLAIPLLAGPGSITTVMVLRPEIPGPTGAILVTAALVVILSLTGLIVAGADRVLGRLGRTGMRIIEKLMGLLLTVIAVQLIIDGLVPVVVDLAERL
ncbi:MAG TPA: MarC family protein [Candidatus Krumholzibacteria bacterium]|nr:MarC family protein [Candidatus Krumholzibacteria bacterium]HPD72190.1 MarC family protein [Candidatus Krumholzibacteria bacterium]HRY40878.1 MarC family protein [Candidatus Krumholzibacteria bacterium]